MMYLPNTDRIKVDRFYINGSLVQSRYCVGIIWYGYEMLYSFFPVWWRVLMVSFSKTHKKSNSWFAELWLRCDGAEHIRDVKYVTYSFHWQTSWLVQLRKPIFISVYIICFWNPVRRWGPVRLANLLSNLTQCFEPICRWSQCDKVYITDPLELLQSCPKP